MSTRKPKPPFQSMIELPAEQLELLTITVDPRPVNRDVLTSQATKRSASRSLPYRGKVTLH